MWPKLVFYYINRRTSLVKRNDYEFEILLKEEKYFVLVVPLNINFFCLNSIIAEFTPNIGILIILILIVHNTSFFR